MPGFLYVPDLKRAAYDQVWFRYKLLGGNNRIGNGTMEDEFNDLSGGGGGTVNLANGWSNSGAETDGTDTLDEENIIVHAGEKSQKCDVNAANEGISEGITSVVNQAYTLECWVYVESGTAQVQLNGTNLGTVVVDDTLTEALWTRVAYDFTALDVSTTVLFLSKTTAAKFYVDDVVITPKGSAVVLSILDAGAVPRKEISGLGARPANDYVSRSQAIFWDTKDTGGTPLGSGAYSVIMWIDGIAVDLRQFNLP